MTGMRIAIAGGTGTLGSYVAAALTSRGHEVRVLSRSAAKFPVDLVSGQGLAAALEDCDAVVDASNATSARRAQQVLVEGSRRLLTAGQAAGGAVEPGLRHAVPRARRLGAGGRGAVRRAARARDEDPAGRRGRGRAGCRRRGRGRPPPGAAPGGRPQVRTGADLARTWRTATGRRAVMVGVPVPGRLGRALRDGGLTTASPDVRGSVTFADWLAKAV